jgi:hypothetical protein
LGRFARWLEANLHLYRLPGEPTIEVNLAGATSERKALRVAI